MAGGPDRLPAPYRAAFPLFIALFLALGLAGIDRSCPDAADSAYLISADAVARGLMPYRDFLAAHPPLIYLLGAPLAKLGAGVLPFRVFSLAVAAATGLLAWRLARKVSGDGRTAFLAGVLTLFAPLGVFFTKSYLNDSLVALVAAGVVVLLLGGGRRNAALAGILCILGTAVKLTFLPFLAVFSLYVIFFRRREHHGAGVFLAVALGGSLAAALAFQALTGGAYLSDILGSQASKGYSFTNFYEGLHRIWQMDWPLIIPAPLGIWFLIKRLKGRPESLLVLGWLAAGLAALATLPAEGHDTNLFIPAEPALALLAAWGIVGLSRSGSRLKVAAAVILLAVSVAAIAEKDRSFFFNSNEADTLMIVDAISGATTICQPVLVPGCYALAADRPVMLEFYDQFLWEEKYRRGDSEARELFEGLAREVTEGRPAPVVLYEGQPTGEILKQELESKYSEGLSSATWPPVTLRAPKEAGGGG